jgi:hypothetical protein
LPGLDDKLGSSSGLGSPQVEQDLFDPADPLLTVEDEVSGELVERIHDPAP